jgi:cob(I)alamin adenosyltransferase
MSITTRTGDQGRTKLFSGQEVSKSDPAPRAYGALDEAVSVLGIARSLTDSDALRDQILWLQTTCFEVGADLATHPDSTKRHRVTPEVLKELDTFRDELESNTPLPKDFVIPGGNPVAAHLDHARTVFRRCEQEAVGLLDSGFLRNELTVQWLNRVSDTLWLMARQMEGDAVIPRRKITVQ